MPEAIGTHLPLKTADSIPAWPGSGRRGTCRCQPLAMPVMSALPVLEGKGATANHSPSTLPAGVRQRREAELCSRPNKSLFAQASLAMGALKQRVLQADCFWAIMFFRWHAQEPRPAEALKASRCHGPAGL